LDAIKITHWERNEYVPNLTEQTLGRYNILELLDEGGMAAVYRANDTRLERSVAVKVIRTEKFIKIQLDEILQRFEREAKALAKLSHPNIVHVLDYGEYEGSPYLVMEYLPGGTLKKKMNNLISWREAIQMLLPIMDGLIYSHQNGILHRDIKPSNILFKEDGTPVLTDFGISKLLQTVDTHSITGTGEWIGTPGYMAPEQHINTKLDIRTDIYQLGIVLYEMITGHRPSDLISITDAIPSPRNFVSDFPINLEKVLLKALALKLSERYQNMGEFKKALQRELAKQRKKDMTSRTESDLHEENHPVSFPQGTLSIPKLSPDVIQEDSLQLFKRNSKKTSVEERAMPRQKRPLQVFLCYTKPDKPKVKNLYDSLIRDGVKTFFDSEDLLAGENWRAKIHKEMRNSDAIIVCLTKRSRTKEGFIQTEIKLALDIAKEKPSEAIFLIPARLEECELPIELVDLQLQYADLFNEGGYKMLHRALSKRAEQVHATPPDDKATYTKPKHENPKNPRYALNKVIIGLAALTILFILANVVPSVTSWMRPILTSTSTSLATTIPISTETPMGKTPQPGLTIFPRETSDSMHVIMLLVQSGKFTMGYSADDMVVECKKYSNDCSRNQFVAGEPSSLVFLDSYYIDKYEVTNAQYKECVDAGRCKPPMELRSSSQSSYYGTDEFANYPVIHVDWFMAKAYCEWRGARLPTEAEWEKAARGIDENLFPWGNFLDATNANFCDKNCPFSFANQNLDDGYRDTAPVDVLPNGKNTYGVFNMAGNVGEWVNSLYRPYPYSANDGRENPDEAGARVLRGGSWRENISSIFSTARNAYNPLTEKDNIGFRCVRTP